MRSQVSAFRLSNRGFDDTLLLAPGWATDHRVFDCLDLPFNYLTPVNFSIRDFEKELLKAMRENGLARISVLGWSMGSFLVSDFAIKYPDMADKVIMVSVKKHYDESAIEKTKTYLRNDKAAYLYKFYHDFFSRYESSALSWFKKNLLKSYIEKMDIGRLLAGLDYLSGAHLDLEDLKTSKVKIVHGRMDRIAPMEEALEIKEALPHAEFIAMERTGHVPFLNPDFKRIFDG